MPLPYHKLCKIVSPSTRGHRADELQLQKLFCRLCRQSLGVYKYHLYTSSITRAGELLLMATGMESDFFHWRVLRSRRESADDL